MQTNSRIARCHDHDLNTDRKRRLFMFRKGTEVLNEVIRSGLLSAAYQNGDQHYDVGPLCSISAGQLTEIQHVMSFKLCFICVNVPSETYVLRKRVSDIRPVFS